ncbi:MAG: guanylate kinase [Myxococcota bacterium]
MISAPSGAGKTTLCRGLMDKLAGVQFSISHTTRAPRPAERDGFDYHFVTPERFEELVEHNEFLEWAHVHGRCYGTSRRSVKTGLAQGIDILFDIDVQGGQQIHAANIDAILVFVLPPNMAILEERLRRRRSDSEEQIAQRLQAARDEINTARGLYTHWIVNDDLPTAVDKLRSILIAERLRRIDVPALLNSMLG